MAERWLPVEGYEGIYEVSDEGRVRSLDHLVPNARWGGDHVRLMRGRILKAGVADGYHTVVLSRPGADYNTVRVQYLVAAAFLGPKPDGLIVCHNNGDRSDNRVGNLRYDTYSGNNLDTVRHGNHWLASKTHCKHGHEFTPENTYVRREGGRKCKACTTARRAA